MNNSYLGLTFITISENLGTYSDFFIPDQDMPDYPHSPGYDDYRDEIITPHGNKYLYDKGKTKSWDLNFTDISTSTKDKLQHCCDGWLSHQQFTIIFFGSLVNGTAISAPGTSCNFPTQCWGTGYLIMSGKPNESGLDLWNISINIKEFGPNQTFTKNYQP